MLCLVNHYTPDLLSDYVDMRAYNFNTFSSVVSNDAILQINNVNKNKYNIIDYSRSQVTKYFIFRTILQIWTQSIIFN